MSKYETIELDEIKMLLRVRSKSKQKRKSNKTASGEQLKELKGMLAFGAFWRMIDRR